MKKKESKHILYADDNTESIAVLLKIRLPSLLIGLAMGVVISFLTSKFEGVLSRDVRVAYFLPFITYMADSIATQTQSIYARNLKSGKADFRIYLIKESTIGFLLGVAFGAISWLVVRSWFGDNRLALSVGLSMFAVLSTAPIVSLFITQAVQSIKEDPAAGSGPIDSAIQSMCSVLIYCGITTMVFFKLH